ncbi:acid beta-fructofuranosidase [Trifolium repens]|nr:acid beta-fructofuranosidase [Trifolium repens]
MKAYTSNDNHDLHTPLLNSSQKPSKVIFVTFGSIVFLMSMVALIIIQSQNSLQKLENTTPLANISLRPELPRGVAQGVSAKSNPSHFNEVSYNWTNAMFSWQRTAFHFQPQKNWMNGPLFHLGWYHLFYQYNPDSAVWGNITWGHAVSTDLIHWLYLPIAMVPDEWFDINGVWTGSATLLPNGEIKMLYTGDTDNYVQVQNLAYPANLSDPLLLDWVKYADNPILEPPPGIGLKDFRDPTTAWIGPDGKWRILIGSKKGKTGLSLVYKTTNFTNFELNDNYLHAVPGTGMWECVDFYPVLINGSNGLDTSVNGPQVKHVLKASLDDTKVDCYAIGTYFVENDTWVPDDPLEDVGIGLLLDYGRYYASKTFYDPVKKRRILWGWINETDSESDDLEKGWASLQTIPRTVLFDNKTGTNLLLWPVEEIESLRLSSDEYEEIVIEPGSVVPLNISQATQLDIFAEFEIETLISKGIVSNDTINCGSGSADRSAFGPFGILAIADDTLSEQTPVYFRLSNISLGDSTTFFCVDETRSSKAPEVAKPVYGSSVPVLSDEKLSMRVLVDHSIIESFGQGGRRVISGRVYPTEAIYGAARLFLFNNATNINIKVSIKIWHLNSAFIGPFPFDQSL